MKKRKAGKLFLSIFIKSLLMIIMLLTAGILSYKAVVYFWQPKEDDSVVAYKDENKTKDNTKIVSDGIVKNLIYCYDDETKDINKIVLELLDSTNLTYITIPVRTQFTMSASLYKKMVLDYPDIPQVLKLSAISKCFSFKNQFEYGTEIIEDMLGTDINYYTAIPQSKYDEIFTQKNIKQADGNGTVPEEVFSNDYRQYLKNLDSKEKLSSYIEDIYPDIKSDLSLENKLKYLDNYFKIPITDITFDLIKGQNLNNAYVIDQTNLTEQLTGLN